jgi:uncharacterized protein
MRSSTNRLAAPPAFHVMVKPRGAVCNLDCRYCFYLSKERLYPNSGFRMEEELLETYTRQYIDSQRVPEVTFAWQGGEPTLMGVNFFKLAVALQQKHRKPGTRILNTLQTNGTLLDDDWCRFFSEHGFLIGVSLDGPRRLHDAFRVDKGGKPTFEKVMKRLDLLKKHNVEFNVLAAVHAANAAYPLEVYRFLRDEARAQFIQFIPIVELAHETGSREGGKVTERSVTARQCGDFLIAIFNEWVRRDVGQTYVQIFDVALGTWFSGRASLCIFCDTCGNALALEHNGDLYSCDHFVEPEYKLGNIKETHLIELVGSQKQRRFGQDKRDKLPQYCHDCEVHFACNGGCPKDRFMQAPDGEPGLNYLCEGYRAFFNHIDKPMRFMAAELRTGRAPANIMQVPSADAASEELFREGDGSCLDRR